MQRNARSLLFVGACTFAVLAAAMPCPGRTLWVDCSSQADKEDGSPEAPFTTIAAAIGVVEPGDVVTVRGGVYRENMRLPSGEPGKPITLRAADDQRVVISGCEKLEGWQKADDGIWTTTLDWKPKRLFAAGRQEILKKVGEEAVEVVLAGAMQEDERVVYESADLVYHLLVMLAERGLCWSDVESELRRRFH